MGGVQPSDEAGSSLISITVLSVTPARAGKLFALASVAVNIDGVQIAIRGIRALRYEPITLTTPDGVKLAAWYVPCTGARAGIVVCHGYHANRQGVASLLPFLHQADNRLRVAELEGERGLPAAGLKFIALVENAAGFFRINWRRLRRDFYFFLVLAHRL